MGKQRLVSRYHQALGHIGLDRLKFMSENRTTADMVTLDMRDLDGFCTDCIRGKMNRAPFGPAPLRGTRPGEMLHVDLFEMNVLSMGYNYFVLITDDCSRLKSAFKIKHKSDALVLVLKYISKINAEFEQSEDGRFRVRCLRFDPGELHSQAMSRFAEAMDITLEMGLRKTPEEDGVAERNGGTTQNVLRTILSQVNVGEEAWALFLDQVIRIINVWPILSLGIFSPYESWTGTSPFTDHFQVPGCGVLYHTEKSDRKKLNPKANAGLYLGSPSRSHVEILDANTGKIIRRRFADCIFVKMCPFVPYIV